MGDVMGKEEQISAMLDGELSEQELAQVLASLDEGDLDAWHGYSMVGDLIRSSELAAFHDEPLLKRIEGALEQEVVVVAPQLKTVLKHRFFEAFVSIAAAGRASFAMAAVCFLAVLVYRVVPLVDGVGHGQSVAARSAQTVGAADLALWEEYLIAHHHHSVNGAIPSWSSMGRIDPRNLVMIGQVDEKPKEDSSASDWLNVWRDAPYDVSVVQQTQ
jgi:negative regulator of sigma E activity